MDNPKFKMFRGTETRSTSDCRQRTVNRSLPTKAISQRRDAKTELNRSGKTLLVERYEVRERTSASRERITVRSACAWGVRWWIGESR